MTLIRDVSEKFPRITISIFFFFQRTFVVEYKFKIEKYGNEQYLFQRNKKEI
jgi:hypothetical protein